MIRKESFGFSVPARLDQLSVICERTIAGIRKAAPRRVSDSTLYEIELAVSELATNIITHAYDEVHWSIDVSVDVTRKGVVIETHDLGAAFSLEDVPLPDLEHGQMHGYGVFLMRELLDDVAYTHKDGINIWRLTKKW